MVQAQNGLQKNNSEPVVNQPLNSMDARYVPVVDFTEHRSTDAQGLPQVKDILFTDGNQLTHRFNHLQVILLLSWMETENLSQELVFLQHQVVKKLVPLT